MYTFSLLVNSTDMTCFIHNLKLSYTLFSSSHIDKEVDKTYKKLEELFFKLGTCNQVDKEEEEEETLDEEIFTTEVPFKRYFDKEMVDVHICKDDKLPANPLHIPKWADILDRKWLATTPFWTSFFRGTVHGHAHRTFMQFNRGCSR